jgi:hypothetical protein
MVGGGVAVLAALLAQQGTPELYAGGTLDLRVGRAPTGMRDVGEGRVVPDQQSHVLTSATPLLGLRWVRGSSELRAVSTTRVLWRPVPLPNERPLVLETLEAAHGMQPSKRTRWQLNLRSTLGEEDYTSLAGRFPNQAMAPMARSLFTVGATSDATWMASRRTTLGLLLDGSYRLPLDQGSPSRTDSEGTPGQAPLPAPYLVMPTQASVTVSPVLRYRLGRRTSLELVAPISDNDLRDVRLIPLADRSLESESLRPTSSRRSASLASPDRGRQTGTPGLHVNILTVQPQVGVIRELNRRQRLRVFAGVTYAKMLVDPAPGRNWLTLTPLARAELDSLLTRTRISTVRSVVALTSSWYADSALGIAVWRGTAEARLEGQFGPSWNASLRGMFTTNLNRPLPSPSASGSTAYVLDETIVQLDAPLRYRVSSQTAIEFGGRYAERGPNLRGGEFTWRNRELWAFFSVTSVTSRVARQRP